MLQEQRRINPEFQNSHLLELCPQADEWVKQVRELQCSFEYAEEHEDQAIQQKIQTLRKEIADFALRPISITFNDLPAYMELYEHIMHALQSLDLFLLFHPDLPPSAR